MEIVLAGLGLTPMHSRPAGLYQSPALRSTEHPVPRNPSLTKMARDRVRNRLARVATLEGTVHVHRNFF